MTEWLASAVRNRKTLKKLWVKMTPNKCKAVRTAAAVKNQAVRTAAVVKNQAVRTVAAVKNQAVRTVAVVKDQVAETEEGLFSSDIYYLSNQNISSQLR